MELNLVGKGRRPRLESSERDVTPKLPGACITWASGRLRPGRDWLDSASVLAPVAGKPGLGSLGEAFPTWLSEDQEQGRESGDNLFTPSRWFLRLAGHPATW